MMAFKRYSIFCRIFYSRNILLPPSIVTLEKNIIAFIASFTMKKYYWLTLENILAPLHATSFT
jgi:hypothetical protein